MRGFTQEQAAAVARRDGPLLLAAAAGSGKTSVLVERFVRSVLDDGLRATEVLAITFTEKAAGELRSRVRARLLDLGAREAAQDIEAAWISTIHGLCARILRGHAVAAGLDPAFTVLDETAARDLRAAAWDAAFAGWLDEQGDPAVELAAAYGPDRLADAVRDAHDALRSAGASRPELPPPPPVRDVGAARAALLRAAPAAAAELAAAKPGARVDAARAAVAACDALGDDPTAAALEAARFSTWSMASLTGPAATAYLDALLALATACRDGRAVVVAGLLDALLRRYATAYAEAKSARSGLDFDDLELGARDLLRDEEAVRAAYDARFPRVMVDEFQDTNPLQLELVDLLAPGRAFVVGDELQSIYGFRHADIEVFRRRRAALSAGDAVATLTANFRSHPDVIAAVNAAFAERVGEGYTPLRPGRAPAAAPAGGDALRVELLLTGTEGWEDVDLGPGPPTQAWRRAEARLLAQRIRDLVDAGDAGPEDVVVLLRAVGALPVFERALQDAGLPTLAVGGRGYWARGVVRDLCGWLAVVANPRDEVALLGVLASPLVGASTDALALVAEAGTGNAWRAIRRAFLGDGDPLAARLPPEDRERLAAFAERLERERELAPRLGLDELLDRVVRASSYDLHVLSLPGGERRLANVHKLLRLAAEHEGVAGRDVRGLVDRATAELEADAREPDAPVELGDEKAVRLMTIHAAKGLEFPVVCVADLGRRPQNSTPDLLVRDGRIGLRLVGIDGDSRPALAYDDLRARAVADASQEETRIAYVALTRACDRLVVSGALDPGRWPADGPATPPIAWLAPALVPGVRDGALSADEPVRDLAWTTPEGEQVRVRAVLSTPAGLGRVLRAPGSAAAAGTEIARPAILTTPAEDPAPAPAPPVTLSYTALRLWRSCGYRFYLQRILRLPEDRAPAPRGGEREPRQARDDATGALDPRVRGSLAHALLEDLDHATGGPWASGDRAAALELVRAAGPRLDVELTGEEVADLDALVAVVARGPLRERLARARRVHREHAFAFPFGETTMNGVVDVLAEERDGGLVLVDWKSDRLDGVEDLEAFVAGDYGIQRTLYALAALRTGAPHVEVVYALLDRPAEPVVRTYAARDLPALEAELGAIVSAALSGGYDVTPHPHRELCATCPGRRALCSWPEEMTLRTEGAPT